MAVVAQSQWRSLVAKRPGAARPLDPCEDAYCRPQLTLPSAAPEAASAAAGVMGFVTGPSRH
eukprot:10523463-Alexandrium_andersonii.AAC.1